MAAVILILVAHAATCLGQISASVEPFLGVAPKAPLNFSGPAGISPRKLDLMTPGLSVNTGSREQVRQFYNAVFSASEGVPVDSTANTSKCDPGTNSTALLNAELLRINWFRAMSGIPAAVTFSAAESAEDQSAALIMSANDELVHDGIPTNWSCFDPSGTNAAANSNLAKGVNGPDAITSFIWDYGYDNWDVGHRRWLLYPQTQVMGSGDVPAQGAKVAANATWIIDADNLRGPRPPTSAPYIAWPPPGFAPYPVVFPQWSFALSTADLGLATVTMESNGVPLDVVKQPYAIDEGENTIVWYPTNLVPSNFTTVFPFDGADTTYDITVNTAGTNSWSETFNYSVTVFDPASPGSDYVPTIVSGTNRPSVNENNPYFCAPSANPDVTGYQWVTSRTTNGSLTDNALNGLANFTISPPPAYSVITNPPVGSGKCFHLTHTNPVPQLLQFNEVLFPTNNTSLSFNSFLGFATTNEVARVQISTNGGAAWEDLYSQMGTGFSSNKAFAAHTLSLSNYAGRIASMRFNYDYVGSNYFAESSNNFGWCLQDIQIKNASQLVGFSTNNTASTDFDFVPTLTGTWVVEARGMIFNQFGLDWSPARQLTGVTNKARPLVLLGSPGISANQAQIPFTVIQGAPSFTLLQASQINGPWTTNVGAELSTLVVPYGSS